MGKSANSGFTLLEVLIALAIMTVMLTSIFLIQQSSIEATIRAHDVLRLKGFAALPGAAARLAIQAVGPRVSAYFDRPWKDGEMRETALVVIGESPLDREAITASLRQVARAAA